MRKLSVPYTINRSGVYYLNLRWNNQFIRQSLATKHPMEAFQKVNQLAPIFSNPQTCEQTLRQQVSEMVGSDKRLRGNALTLVQPDESSLVLSQGFRSLEKHLGNGHLKRGNSNSSVEVLSDDYFGVYLLKVTIIISSAFGG
mgnify:CR=1 FL=1